MILKISSLLTLSSYNKIKAQIVLLKYFHYMQEDIQLKLVNVLF